MNVNGKFLCSRCMCELEDECICTHCGYDPSDKLYLQSFDIDEKQVLEEGTIFQNRRYQIGTVIGAGGFGITYSAWDFELEQPVAIKEYFPSEGCTRNTEEDDSIRISTGFEIKYKLGLARTNREAKILTTLQHIENIVKVYEHFEANNTVYIVMQYIQGVPINQYVSDNKLSPKEIISVMRSIIDALALVHEEGIIHRDINPANILVQEDGRITLIDFGAASTRKRREQGKDRTGIFTEKYSPIEQYDGSDGQGPCTDVYGLSATLYALICGEAPVAAPSRIGRDTLKSPSELNVPLKKYQNKAIMSGLAVQPTKRTQTMKIFRSMLYNEPMPEEVQIRRRIMLYSASIAALFSGIIILFVMNLSYGLFFVDGVRYSLYWDGLHARGFYYERENLEIPQEILGLGVVQIDDRAFKSSQKLAGISVPGTVKNIGSSAFNSCTNLSGVLLSDGVQKISARAFANCDNLQAFITPDSVNEIAVDTFMNSQKRLIMLVNLGGQPEKLAKELNITYAHIETKENESGITVLKYETEQTRAYLPDFINGKPVTAVDSEVSGLAVFPSYVRSVILPKNLTRIGGYAFNKAEIDGIDLPLSVDYIGECAFSESFLEAISLPDSVKFLGIGAFMSCMSLESAKLSAGMKSIPAGCFDGDNKLREVIIPEGFEEINALAFGKCSALSSVELPDSLRIIGNSAFMDCTSLKDLYMPPSVQYVSISAFDGCSNEMTIIGYEDTLAQNFSGRYSFNFYDMSNYDPRFEITPAGNLIVHRGVEESEVTALPSHYKSSLAKRLLHAKYLRSHKVILPKYLEEIAGSSFYGNRYLQSISLPETAKMIGTLSFANCSELTSIDINEGLERIGQAAFAECTGLTEIKFPQSLKYLGAEAFTGCKNLESFTIPGSLVLLDDDVFSGTAVKSITIPGNISRCGTSFYGCQNLQSVIVSEGVRTLWGTFADCTSLESVIIPSTVNQVSRSTFHGCKNLKDIWIYSDSVELDFVSWGAGHKMYHFTDNENEIDMKYIFLDKNSNPLFTDCKNLTIHAHRGSSSHVYANSHGITFMAIEDTGTQKEAALAKFNASGRIFSEEKLLSLISPSEGDEAGLCWSKFRYALGYGYTDIALKCLDAYGNAGKEYDKAAAESARLFISQSEFSGGEVVLFFEDNKEHSVLRAGDIIVAVDGNEIHTEDDMFLFLKATKDKGHNSCVYTIMRAEQGTLKKLDVTVTKDEPRHATLSLTAKTFEEQ